VVAVHDLDAAGDFYRRLGFQVGARNRHPWGTENRLVQFASSFIELITVADPAAIPSHTPGKFSFGAFLRDYLEEDEGLAMLALDSIDAKSDAILYAEEGIGSFEPFYFERSGVLPDGVVTRVAFSLAFAREPRSPRAAFFVCQQHIPENFWKPDFQRHPNRARNVRMVSLKTSRPREHEGFLQAFTGAAAPKPGSDGALTFALNGGFIKIAPDNAGEAAANALRFDSFSVATSELDRVPGALTAARIDFTRSAKIVVVPSSAAFGVHIVFSAED
jgi:Glyoxalase-like domain